MTKLNEEEKTQELMTVHNKVKELTGYDMFLFRPPYGDYDNEVVKNARKNDYYPIQWNIDSLDWKDYGADDIVRTCNRKQKSGKRQYYSLSQRRQIYQRRFRKGNYHSTGKRI